MRRTCQGEPRQEVRAAGGRLGTGDRALEAGWTGGAAGKGTAWCGSLFRWDLARESCRLLAVGQHLRVQGLCVSLSVSTPVGGEGDVSPTGPRTDDLGESRSQSALKANMAVPLSLSMR